MKSIGITRKVDELGRIVLPIELRRTMGIAINDPVAIFVDEDAIILKKYQIACILCGNNENLLHFKDKAICSDCKENLLKL